MANDEMDDTWKELAEYIDANFDTKLTSTDLARKFFYNPSYFSRVFKEKFGVTFMEYITRKRLGYAIDLLKNTDISNDEIAQRSGFSDSKSLYNAFSKYLNSTPSQYRKGKM
jgi:two-component system response regulator YesN